VSSARALLLLLLVLPFITAVHHPLQ